MEIREYIENLLKEREINIQNEDLDLYLEANESYALHIKSVIPYRIPQHNKRVIQNFAYVED